VNVTDNGIPAFKATNDFMVQVETPPWIQSFALSNGLAAFNWTAISGRTYQIEFTANPASAWTNLPGTIVAPGNTASGQDEPGTNALRFYRVLVNP
jgi:hypothetical protein